MPELFRKDIFFDALYKLWQDSGLSKLDFYDKVGIRNAFSVYAPAKPGQKQRKVKAPSIETLLKISAEFHVSVNYLLTGQEHPAEGEKPPPGKDYVDLPPWNQDLLNERERRLLHWTLDVLRSEDQLPNVATALETNIVALRDSVEKEASRPRCHEPPSPPKRSHKQASEGGSSG